MPKCAGWSLREKLRDELCEQLELDYDSYFKIPQKERSEKILSALKHPKYLNANKVVYGHFFPVKYIGDAIPCNHKLVTILRDPINRLISHYKFWRLNTFDDSYLWEKMTSENWTLSDFIMSDEMRNFYSQYFVHCPVGYFSYIGIYENLDESIHKCFMEIGLEGMSDYCAPHTNKTGKLKTEDLSPAFLKQARNWHSDDYLIYDYAVRKFHAYLDYEDRLADLDRSTVH